MKSEAARRIRLANPGSSEEARVSETVAKDSDMSARQVERYVKLTKLNRQLLDMLDAGEINMSVAQELANLSTVEQCWVHDYMKEHDTAINAVQAKKLRRAFQKEGAVEEDIAGILAKETTVPANVEKVETVPDINPESYSHNDLGLPVKEETPAPPDAAPALNYERISAYFPDGTIAEEMNDRLCELLEFYAKILTFYDPSFSENLIRNNVLHLVEMSAAKRRQAEGAARGVRWYTANVSPDAMGLPWETTGV